MIQQFVERRTAGGHFSPPAGRIVAGLLLLTWLVTAATGAVGAQEAEKAEVLVLGTFHFAAVPDETDDVMRPARQEQIEAVVESLTRFRPTRIAVEAVPADSAVLDSLYRAYREGRHDLTANERQQLGFRLARRFGHERLYPVDFKQPWPNHVATSWAEKNRPGFLDYYREWRQRRRTVHDSLYRHADMAEILLHFNGADHLRSLEELRMRKLELGAGTEYPGMAPVRSMYERDLRIFANLTRVAEPGERTLVIFGSGHVAHLRDFVRRHPEMELVKPAEYLRSHPSAPDR